jgi:hypothetical protein
MTDWASYVLTALEVDEFPADAREKALNAASLDYTGDTNLQSGMVRLLRGGSNTVTVQEYNGSSWVTQQILAASVGDLPASQITSGTLSASRIPSLPASQITSGAFADARIPNLNASKITAGEFSVSRIPDLPASQITSGIFSASRIPSLPASQITSGEFSTARIPDLPTSQITSGTFSNSRLPTIDATRHGDQTDGDLHATATASVPGFMSTAHYDKVNNSARTQTAIQPSNQIVSTSTYTTLLSIGGQISLRDGIGWHSFELEMLVDSGGGAAGLDIRIGNATGFGDVYAFGYAIEPSGTTVAASVDNGSGAAELSFADAPISENASLIRITGWINKDTTSTNALDVDVRRNVGVSSTDILRAKLTVTSEDS